jgi:hypothetical protein
MMAILGCDISKVVLIPEEAIESEVINDEEVF